MASIQQIQDSFYKSLNRSMWKYFSRKYRRGLKVYPELFKDTIEHRFALVNYINCCEQYKGNHDSDLENRLKTGKNKVNEASEKWMSTLSEIDTAIDKGRLDYDVIKKFAEKNMFLAHMLKFKFQSIDEDFAESQFVDIYNAAKTIRVALADRELRKDLISKNKTPFAVEGLCALDSVSSGYELNNYVPILKIAVSCGYVDQEDAHLAIMQGLKKSKNDL